MHIGGANDVSFLGSGQDMYVANANNSKSIIFSTGTSATPFFAERMRITNAGNVGINNSNPQTQLHVIGIGTTQALNNRGGLASFQASNGAMEVFASTNPPYGFGFQVRDLTAFTPIPLLLEPAGGNVGIGNVNPAAKLDLTGVKSSGASTGTATSGNDGPSQLICPAGYNGTSRYNDWPSGWGGAISTYDICGASTFCNANVIRSDRKLKTNILDMNDDIVKDLLKLHPVTYFMKEQTKEMEGIQYGFIAQEVREIFPTIVTKADDENGTIGMNYQALISPTIYVVQKQQLKIEELHNKIAEMEKQMKAIQALLSNKKQTTGK